MYQQHFILDGTEPIEEPDILKWAEWIDKADRTVQKTTINDVEVSTVFLGMNYQYQSGPPILFETMVFGGDLDGEMMRYCTWDEAVNGHNEMVERVKADNNDR